MENSLFSKLSSEELQYARDWISECSWEDLDCEDIDELSDSEVVQGIEKHFCGGLKSFKDTFND